MPRDCSSRLSKIEFCLKKKNGRKKNEIYMNKSNSVRFEAQYCNIKIPRPTKRKWWIQICERSRNAFTIHYETKILVLTACISILMWLTLNLCFYAWYIVNVDRVVDFIAVQLFLMVFGRFNMIEYVEEIKEIWMKEFGITHTVHTHVLQV